MKNKLICLNLIIAFFLVLSILPVISAQNLDFDKSGLKGVKAIDKANDARRAVSGAGKVAKRVDKISDVWKGEKT